MTDVTSNVQAVDHTLTQAEIAQAIHHLASRKAYNARPEVKEARKKYARARMERIKYALKVYKQAQKEGRI